MFNILVHARTDSYHLWQNQTSSNMEFDFDGKCLRHPFTAMVCGATQSGKTCFVQKVLEHNQEIICPHPTRIMWCYGSYQTAYDEMLKTVKPTIEFFKGVPDDLSECINPSQNNVLIIDDLMAEAGDDKSVTDLFTKGSHHMNLSIIY